MRGSVFGIGVIDEWRMGPGLGEPMIQGPAGERGGRRLSVRLHFNLQFRFSVAEDRPSRQSGLWVARVVEPDQTVAVGTREGGSWLGAEEQLVCRLFLLVRRQAFEQCVDDE